METYIKIFEVMIKLLGNPPWTITEYAPYNRCRRLREIITNYLEE